MTSYKPHMTCLYEVTFAAEKICVKGRYLFIRLLTDVTMAVARKANPRLEAEKPSNGKFG